VASQRIIAHGGSDVRGRGLVRSRIVAGDGSSFRGLQNDAEPSGVTSTRAESSRNARTSQGIHITAVIGPPEMAAIKGAQPPRNAPRPMLRPSDVAPTPKNIQPTNRNPLRWS